MSAADENDDTRGSADQTDDDGWAVARDGVQPVSRTGSDEPNAPPSAPAEQVPALDAGAGWSDVAGIDELEPPVASATPDADLRAAVGVSRASEEPDPARVAGKPEATRAETPARLSAASTSSEKAARESASPRKPARPEKPRGAGMSRRAVIALGAIGLFLVLVFVIWFMGQRNSRSFYIVCGDSITAERGRAFPPWGTNRLSGDAWQPIEVVVMLGPCDDASFTSRDELEVRWRELLLWQASAWLQKLDPEQPRDNLDTVRAQLGQAASVSRGSDDKSIEARKEIARLLGDVAYWEAQDQLAAVKRQLDAAAERLRTAVEHNPVHVRDADQWRKHLDFLQRELAAGPSSLRPSRAPENGAAGAEDLTQAEPDGMNAVELRRPDEELDAAGDALDIEPGDGEPAADAPASPGVPNPPPPGSGTLL